MSPYPKRLIEVDLPIKRISAHARREKSIRHGHISTLHIWWARRPLAACRAVICAALWPDPADELCPAAFRAAAAKEILAFARKAMTTKSLADGCSPESMGRWNAYARVDYQLDLANPDHLNNLRYALFDFIADFANWDNATNPHFLAASRALTQASHEALGGLPGTRPLVVDPFAGGGAIPLEALRVGADAFASDLNPVAVLLNKVVLEYIPKYGKAELRMKNAEGEDVVFQGLAEAVRYWGGWIKEQAEKELAQFYPKDPDGATPIAYLWARTIISEAPDDGTGIPVEVPLLSSMWLAKRTSRSKALRWVRDEMGQVRTEILEIAYSDGVKRKVRRPRLEIFEPMDEAEVGFGTVGRGSATCPITGYTTPVESVRRQLRLRRGGADDGRLLAVVVSRRNEQGRSYRLPTPVEQVANQVATDELERRKAIHREPFGLVPDEALPVMSGVFNAPIYGHTTWGSLFTSRQLLVLSTFVMYVKNTGQTLEINEEDTFATQALQACLALAVSRQADYTSSLCSWHLTRETLGHTFTRQALPMIWDFAEVNPFSESTGDFGGALNWVARVCDTCSNLAISGNVERFSATSHPLPNDSVQVFLTDPPYYNAVPYADLSDYFYVWLKRMLGDKFTSLFGAELAPKDDEICEMAGWDSERYPQKTGTWFEEQMGLALSEGVRVLAPTGIGTVVFAHKSTSGWEALLKALVNAGWIITGSWPIDTEMAERLRARDSATLASSIHLVCRPREDLDGSLRINEIGDWRSVLQEIPTRIHTWLPRLAREGVVGADAIFACLGPALEIFSRYSRVEKASGEVMTLGQYLEYVWAAVSKEALDMVFQGADTAGFEEDARLTAMWLWTLNGGADQPGDAPEPAEGGKPLASSGYTLEYDAARKIAQGLGAHLERLGHLVQVKGGDARLLPVRERSKYLFGVEGVPAPSQRLREPQPTLFSQLAPADAEAAGWQMPAEVAAPPGATVLDRVHQAMLLFAAGRSDALKRFLQEGGVGGDDRFWRLAQALSALYPAASDEKRWVDGVLARKKGLGF